MLDIPVFHDDQHGTAIVVLAALTNALRVVDKELDRTSASWSAGSARPGRRSSTAAPRRASPTSSAATATARIPAGQPATRSGSGSRTTPTRRHSRARLAEMLVGADVFIGVSAPDLLDRRRHRHDGRRTRSCSRWPTPTPRSTRSPPASTPRSWPPAGRTTRTRSTTCWPSPASSAGMLDAGADEITDECCWPRRRDRRRRPARELNASYIVPSVFDPAVAPAVAAAVRAAAAVRT